MRFAIDPPTPSPTRPADCYDVVDADERSEVIASSLTHPEAARMVAALEAVHGQIEADALREAADDILERPWEPEDAPAPPIPEHLQADFMHHVDIALDWAAKTIRARALEVGND